MIYINGHDLTIEQVIAVSREGETVAIAPEAVDGGPIAFIHDGDRIRLDVANAKLDLLVDADVLAPPLRVADIGAAVAAS